MTFLRVTSNIGTKWVVIVPVYLLLPVDFHPRAPQWFRKTRGRRVVGVQINHTWHYNCPWILKGQSAFINARRQWQRAVMTCWPAIGLTGRRICSFTGNSIVRQTRTIGFMASPNIVLSDLLYLASPRGDVKLINSRHRRRVCHYSTIWQRQ